MFCCNDAATPGAALRALRAAVPLSPAPGAGLGGRDGGGTPWKAGPFGAFYLFFAVLGAFALVGGGAFDLGGGPFFKGVALAQPL